jgi:hypothetical protein
VSDPRFDRARDVPALLAITGRARASSDPHAIVHPGGMQWLLRRLGRHEFSVLRWLDGDSLAGFAVDDSGYVTIHAATPSLDQHLMLLERTESHRRKKGETAIEVSVWDDDRELLSTLRVLGYEPSGTSGSELIYELLDAPPEPQLPEGFSMRWLEPKLDDAYVELHRAAWSTWAPSTYDREMHVSVTTMPDFERELVPIIAAPDGTLAAYCIAWFDPRTQTVEIEPLGTRPGVPASGARSCHRARGPETKCRAQREDGHGLERQQEPAGSSPLRIRWVPEPAHAARAQAHAVVRA